MTRLSVPARSPAPRYGVIATVDDSGRVRDFVTSGFTPDEHKQLADWPDGPRLFEHLRDLPGSLRLDDLPGYVRALGYSADLMRSQTFQGMPMRHRGEQVGHFSLAQWPARPHGRLCFRRLPLDLQRTGSDRGHAGHLPSRSGGSAPTTPSEVGSAPPAAAMSAGAPRCHSPDSGASNTAATSATNPSSSGDVAALPRANAPCST